MATETTQRRPGGRSAEKRSAVLSAAVEMLAADGPDALTVAGVASRAGVHETSIYRRWGTRERLILEAMAGLSANLLPVPDTGSLRDDLVVFGQALVAYDESSLGKALIRTMATSEDDDETSRVRSEFWEARWIEFKVIVERAIRRGELPDQVDGRFLLEAFIAPIHMRALLTRQSVTPEFLRRLADATVLVASRTS